MSELFDIKGKAALVTGGSLAAKVTQTQAFHYPRS